MGRPQQLGPGAGSGSFKGVYGGMSSGRSGEKAVEIGLGEMKSLESTVKQSGLDDTMTFEWGRDMVIREVWRIYSSCSVEGFTGGRAVEVLRPVGREGEIWTRVFYPCTVMVGNGIGSSPGRKECLSRPLLRTGDKQKTY